MSDLFIVAYDGSAAGHRAVQFAAGQARAQGAELLIAHVLEWSPYSFLTPQELQDRHKRRNEELARAKSAILDPVTAELAETGLTIRTTIRYGHVTEILSAIAKEEGARQIFIGRTGHSGVAARIFGSVTGALAQMAPVPCTIVP